eukprot:2983801-Ditylum_brightwellii.AAC.1
MLSTYNLGDVGEGKAALDLGCGMGMLMLGCVVMGCDNVWGVDCDAEFMEVAKENLRVMMEEEEEEEEENFQVEFVLGK